MLINIILCILIILWIIAIISICKRNKLESEFDINKVIENFEKQFKEKL